MDCKTARLLLAFARPQHAELDPLELRALEAHVAACPDCGHNANQDRAFDEQLGQAMRQVDVPDQLRSRLLARLARERAAATKWRWKRYTAVAAAVAATLLLVIGICYGVRRATLPTLDVARIEAATQNIDILGHNKDEIKKEYHERGIDMTPPPTLNYAFLVHYGMGTLQGRQVPSLVFIRDNAEANIHAHAIVYVVSDRDFNLSKVPAYYQWSEAGYRYKVEIERGLGASEFYVIVHTGDNLDWLRQ
jgi:hypothetical protein